MEPRSWAWPKQGIHSFLEGVSLLCLAAKRKATDFSSLECCREFKFPPPWTEKCPFLSFPLVWWELYSSSQSTHYKLWTTCASSCCLLTQEPAQRANAHCEQCLRPPWTHLHSGHPALSVPWISPGRWLSTENLWHLTRLCETQKRCSTTSRSHSTYWKI